jgi:hypothetical protein
MDLPAPQPSDQQPVQSLKEILEQRMAETPLVSAKQRNRAIYLRAVRNAVLAGLICMIVYGTVILIQSSR